MKNKGKILLYISLILLLGILFVNIISYVKVYNNNLNRYNVQRKECLTLIKENKLDDNSKKEFCQKIVENNYRKDDFFTAFSVIIHDGLYSFSSLMILFLIIPSSYYICKVFKNNIIQNELLRENYLKMKKKLFKDAYKTAFIIPTIVVIGIVFCAVYTKNFNYKSAIEDSTIIWSAKTLKYGWLFIILYILNVFIHSLLYINIGLCVSRKHHNFFVSIILSFLIFCGIEALLEISSWLIFGTLLKKEWAVMFNIMNMFSYNDTFGILSPIVVPLIFMIISFIIVHLMYKNKESLIIDCEKNI